MRDATRDWSCVVPGIIDDAALLRAFSCLEPFRFPVLAVSGGPDSMALMHLAKRWLTLKSRDLGNVTVVTVDHGLRAESKDEAQFVARAARALGFSHATAEWTGDRPKTGIQAAARAARYRLLATHLSDHRESCIVTAHTEDDQAETFLMRLRRGSGLDGLSAMAVVSQQKGVAIVRPLLGISKKRLLAYLRFHAVAFIVDPSNENAAFERVRVRHAGKALAEAGITRSALALTASRLARSRAALDQISETFLDQHFEITRLGQGKIARDAFEAAPSEIGLRVLARILALIGGGSPPPRLKRLEAALMNLETAKKETTLAGCLIIPTSQTLDFYREAGRLKVKQTLFAPGLRCSWDERFALTFASVEAKGAVVRQLGADGWHSYKKAIKERGYHHEPNRLAALTTPALWRGDQLLCAPLLRFGSHLDQEAQGCFLAATLLPELARYRSDSADDVASELGKDQTIPYL